MPLVTISNRNSSQFMVPPPVARMIAAGGTISVNLSADELESDALTALVLSGDINVTVTKNTALPDNVQAATQEQVGGVLAYNDELTTTDDTVTTISTIPVPTNTTVLLQVAVVAKNATDASKGAAYLRAAAYRNDAGTVSIIGAAATPLTAEDTAGWDVTLVVSTTNVTVRVTGEAAKVINWNATTTVQTVSGA